MSDIATHPAVEQRPLRSVAILVWAQAVLGAQMPVHFILGGLAGGYLAEGRTFWIFGFEIAGRALATLPISMIVLVSMFAAPVISAIMGRYGRRTGFLIGAAAGVVSGLVSMLAMEAKSFEALLAGAAILGIYMAAHNFYRFAAADQASESFRPKAISWVMAGGLMSAVLGPQLVIWFKDWLEPIPFAGAYKAVILLNLVGAIPLLALNIPVPPRAPKGQRSGRPWSEIFADRRIVVAMLCAMVSYALMNLVMTSTPLAMEDCGFLTDDAAEVVRIHVLAMFAPSFFTGPLISRFGAARIIAVGLVTLAAGGVVALAGLSFMHFAVALALIGVGWNFGFIGATSMLAGAHLPEERSRVQGLNDFLLFGLVSIASFSSGILMYGSGWAAVNLAMVPFLTLAAVALAWLSWETKER